MRSSEHHVTDGRGLHTHFVKKACCTLYYELTAACLYIFRSVLSVTPRLLNFVTDCDIHDPRYKVSPFVLCAGATHRHKLFV